MFGLRELRLSGWSVLVGDQKLGSDPESIQWFRGRKWRRNVGRLRDSIVLTRAGCRGLTDRNFDPRRAGVRGLGVRGSLEQAAAAMARSACTLRALLRSQYKWIGSHATTT